MKGSPRVAGRWGVFKLDLAITWSTVEAIGFIITFGEIGLIVPGGAYPSPFTITFRDNIPLLCQTLRQT